MSNFAIGAKWRVLMLDVDVPEPTNSTFPHARAPTVEAKDAEIPPQPKKEFSECFDHPLFQGRVKERRITTCKS